MDERKDMIPVQVKRVGTVYIASTPKLKRLRADIGRLVSFKKRLGKQRSLGRMTNEEYTERTRTVKERLKWLQFKFQEASNRAVEQSLWEITRQSPKTYSEALVKSRPSAAWQGHHRSAQAGLPSLGKRR